MFRRIVKIAVFFAFLIFALVIVNAYFFAPDLEHHGELVAYRGGGSQIDYEKLAASDCSATSLKRSGLHSVENTLEAVAASEAAGADVIHLNIQRTNDDQLVVFHDWKLDCATNGTGALSQIPFDALDNIDAGFGYTFDDGKSFPFRGKGFQISKLEDFYKKYPEHKFFLNLKNNDIQSFNVLRKFILDSSKNLSGSTTVITTARGQKWFQANTSNVKAVSAENVKDCGLDYLLVGWAGIVPDSCRNTLLFLPPSVAKYFWGFPKRLASRLQKYDTDVYLWYEHNPVDLKHLDLINEGVGVITSDLGSIYKKAGNSREN